MQGDLPASFPPGGVTGRERWGMQNVSAGNKQPGVGAAYGAPGLQVWLWPLDVAGGIDPVSPSGQDL